MLQAAFCNILRVPGQAETLRQLKDRANSAFGSDPCMQAVVGQSTLGQLGFTGVTQPKVRISLHAVTVGNRYSVVGTANALGVALMANQPPPANTIGVLKKADILYWVVAEQKLAGQDEGAFSWMPRAGLSVSPQELLGLQHTFKSLIPVIDSTLPPPVSPHFVQAGIDVVGSLSAAMKGNVRAILYCAQYFARNACLKPTVPAFVNGQLTQAAILCLIAWLGMFINANPAAAVVTTEVPANIVV
jgi:hypothetical protein